MTDNEIIKRLEAIEPTEFEKAPSVIMEFETAKEILDLIKRQQAEIERLKPFEKKVLEPVVENLKEIELAKSEAIKEFAERLKEYKFYCQNPHSPVSTYAVEVAAIDKLVKELTEGSK